MKQGTINNIFLISRNHLKVLVVSCMETPLAYPDLPNSLTRIKSNVLAAVVTEVLGKIIREGNTCSKNIWKKGTRS